MKFYLNHSRIEGSTDEDAFDHLKEINSLSKVIREERLQLHVYSKIWDVPLVVGNLKSYIHRLAEKPKNLDEVRATIESIMGIGPYFFEPTSVPRMLITPYVSSPSVANEILQSTFVDGQQNIVSLETEHVLTASSYILSDIASELEVKNLIGEQQLRGFFDANRKFRSIDEVFDEVENRFEFIQILDSARKSSKKHDFRGHFDSVYIALKELGDTELLHIIDGQNDEYRKQEFFKVTNGLEISGEHVKTLNNRRYRRQREFVIPFLGKQLFEWHVKIDGSQTRIHFFIEKNERKVYIGHCGEHLGTSSYNS